MLTGQEDGIRGDGHHTRDIRIATAGILDDPTANVNRCTTRIVELDELITCSTWTARTEFADDDVGWG